MKNLLIYISDTDSFHSNHPDVAPDAPKLLKVQIENSLALGWKKEDILLFTNFSCIYGPITATILKNVEFFDRKPQATKINAIVKLFDMRIIQKGELYWFHDLDAFQLEPISEAELGLKGFDMGLTDYGRNERWNSASVFFRVSAEDIFRRVKDIFHEKNIDEERALAILTKKDESIRKRIKRLNKTYNFTPLNLRTCYKMAQKPLKVAHFHPLGALKKLNIPKLLDFYKGDNKIHTPLIPDRLVKLFKYHRIA